MIKRWQIVKIDYKKSFPAGSCVLLFKIGCVQPSMSRGALKALRRGENDDEDEEEDDEDDEDEDEYDDNDKENDEERCVQWCMSQGALWALRRGEGW